MSATTPHRCGKALVFFFQFVCKWRARLLTRGDSDTTIKKTNVLVIFSLIFSSLGVIADTTIKKKNVLVIFSLIFSLYVSGEHDSLYSSSQFCFSVLICKWRARLLTRGDCRNHYKKNELCGVPPGWLGKHHTHFPLHLCVPKSIVNTFSAIV